jgi:hypothetical protein
LTWNKYYSLAASPPATVLAEMHERSVKIREKMYVDDGNPCRNGILLYEKSPKIELPMNFL